MSDKLQKAINNYFIQSINLKGRLSNEEERKLIREIQDACHEQRLNLYIYINPLLIRISSDTEFRWYDESNYRTGLRLKGGHAHTAYTNYIHLKERNRASHERAKAKRKIKNIIVTNPTPITTWEYKPVIRLRDTSNGYFICKKSHPDRYDDTLYLRSDGTWQQGCIDGQSPTGYYPTEGNALRMLLKAFKADPSLSVYDLDLC